MSKIWALVSESQGIIEIIDLDIKRDGIERYERLSTLFEKDFILKDITENKKIKLNSIWDPETESFSEFDTERSILAKYFYALVQDNMVKCVVRIWTDKVYQMFKIAEQEGVIAVDCTEIDPSTIKVGKKWNGTSFTD